MAQVPRERVLARLNQLLKNQEKVLGPLMHQANAHKQAQLANDIAEAAACMLLCQFYNEQQWDQIQDLAREICEDIGAQSLEEMKRFRHFKEVDLG